MSLRTLARILISAALFLASASAQASGPRWVTGAPYFYPSGRMMVWYTDKPLYFTDPGDLSPYVNHAQADAIVAAAASVWTIPTSRLVLAQGGSLDEHVTSANVYASSTGIVFPSDIQSSNYLNKQIAVLYDSDGSITDLLLGSGASSPSSCRQNAVTDSVDSFAHWGDIQHAILVLNGRCTGPAPEQQLQLQYQLIRAFGRIIGLGWSQTNDNVFTGNPRPTYQQALHWPVMHPIDIICGPYTYQCMPNPFTLRDDDISGLGLLYPVSFFAPPAPGKTDTRARGGRLHGTLTFPNGQGMQGVNIVIHRLEPSWNIPEDWESTSAVTGFLFRRSGSNPIAGSPPLLPFANQGGTDPSTEGYYDIARTPLYDWETWQNYVIYTQPINPLYTGAFSVGPYDSNAVAPSGSVTQQRAWVMGTYADLTLNFTIPDAQSTCTTSNSGTAASPTSAPASGWWTGNLCTYAHTDWSSFPIKPNRTYTLEVTAQDEHAATTTSKLLPVLGLWSTSDPTNSLPAIAATPAAFNSTVTGMTTLTAQSSTQPQQLRLAIADQRGDGRPDYAYQARLLYADTVSPATVPALGGTITITGSGFRPGNTVTINGLPAIVTNWTSTTITAVAPNLHAASATTADVTVRDLATGGATTMTSALNYAAPQPTLILVSAPSGQVFTSSPATSPFAVKALQADGVTPIANIAVTFSADSPVRFNACASSTCTLNTDASGLASTTVTPLSPGSVTLTAAGPIGSVTAAFTTIIHIQTITATNPTLYVAAETPLTWPLSVTLADNAGPTLNLPVQWTTLSGPITPNPAVTTTDAQSTAQTTATLNPLTANTQATAQACAWATQTPSICTNFTATAIDPAQWQLEILSGAGQSPNATATLAPVVLRVHDASGHPIAAAPVTIHQTVEPWTPWTSPCPDQGRCPIAPTYNPSTTTLTSALDGTVTITPLELPNQPEVTHMAAATGTQGFASLTIQKQP
jgi:hypothetical protein